MSNSNDQEGTIDDLAARWVVRANTPDVSEADLQQLTEWLDQSPVHVAAFHSAEMLWARIDELAAASSDRKADVATIATGSASVATLMDYKHRRSRVAADRRGRGPVWAAWAIAVAAAAAVVVWLPNAARPPSQPTLVYQTGKGQTRPVMLSDGTIIVLNSDTKISVRLERRARRLTLDHGEAAFTVVHDPGRPFVVRAGDMVAQDIGTQFDILRSDGTIRIAVKAGEVGVSLSGSPSGPSQQILGAGDQTTHKERTNAIRLESADLDAVFAWEQRRAVYRDLPLSSVVSDLNRYLAKPLVVDSQAAQIKLTAVLVLGSEASVVRQLQSFLPIDAVTSNDSILLRPRR